MFTRFASSPAARNAASSYLAFVSTSLWGLLSIPIAVAFLDKPQIGLWSVINVIIGYLVWMDLGIGAATGRLIANAVADDNWHEIDCWWSVTRVALWVQGVMVIVLGLLLTPVALEWMSIEPTLADDARLLMIGGAIITGLSFPVRGTVGLLTAQNRFHWVPIMQAVVPWLNLAAFYLGLRAGWGLRAYLVGMLTTQIAIWIFCRAFIRFGPYTPKWNRHGIDRHRFVKLFRLSGSMAVVGLVDTVIKGLPAVLIARFGGLSLVPVYNFTSRGPMLGGGLVGRTYQSFYPGMQRLYVSGKKSAFQKKHLVVGRVTLSSALCGAALVLAFNPAIVQLLADHAYFAGSRVNMWFALALITIPLAGLFQMLLPISGSMGKAAPIAIIKLGASAGLAGIFWHWFGMAGLAAVFSLLPFVDLCYSCTRGARSCGYISREFSVPLLTLGGGAMTLTLVAGYLIDGIGPATAAFEVGNRVIFMPSVSTLWYSGSLFFFGLLGLGFSIRGLINELQ